MSSGAYADDKALVHRDRLEALKRGEQPYPVHLHLIISDLCDLDCPGCAYRWSGYSSNQLFGVKRADGSVDNNPARMLSLDLIKTVLDDCAVMGTKAVEFTGGGEPTIHPHAREAIEYAQQLGLETALITNGLHLQRIGEAAVRGQWLRVSIDAATPMTYSVVRPSVGGPRESSFGKALKGIEWAVQQRLELGTPCSIGFGFVVQAENWRELYSAAKLAREVGADNIRISGAFSPQGDAYHANYRQQAMEMEAHAIQAFDGLPAAGGRKFRVHGRFKEKLSDLSAPPDYQSCWYQHLTTYLGGDGNLYRCCVTAYNRLGLIGNVQEAGGLRALWDSHMKRTKYARFDARACPRCQFNDRNRAIDGALAGDVLPPPPNSVHPFFV